MIIVEKNKGKKIKYEVKGTMIFIGDYEIMINAARYQKDYPIHVDICRDAVGLLQTTPQKDGRYVAEIDIPAREYKVKKVKPEKNNDHMADEVLEPVPLSMDDVKLTLWSVEED